MRKWFEVKKCEMQNTNVYYLVLDRKNGAFGQTLSKGSL
jgi:hypothetical protein